MRIRKKLLSQPCDDVIAYHPLSLHKLSLNLHRNPFNLHRTLNAWILGLLLLVNIVDILAQNPKIPFTFNLSTGANTSAGVFKRDGTLIKTLWNNKSYPAGTHTAYWDRTDDNGLMITDTGYVVQVLSNNISYKWEGTVGNNSDSVTGSSKIRAFERFHSMAISGNFAYYAAGYTEGIPSCYKFRLSSPRNKINILNSDVSNTDQEAHYVATDGNNVYWAGFDPFNPGLSFTYATKVSNDLEFMFSTGSSVSTTFGRTYPRAIDVYTSNTSAHPSGLAVQKTGNYLFVAHKDLNLLNVLNKTTGALIQSLSYNAPREVCIDANDDLWMITGNNTVQKYNVNGNGTLSSPILALNGLLDPLAIAVAPNNTKILVIDGASSQQIKAFSNTSGNSIWTLGSAGGYINDPAVNDYKFYFSDSSTELTKPFIAFQADSSFWVGDVGNERVQHYNSNRVFINRIMSLPHSYSTVVDRNDPTRVFNEYLEFKVDYSKTLAPDNGSWVLVRNWRRGIKSNYFQQNMFNIFRQMITLSNGRTYALLEKLNNGMRTPEVVELPSSGNIRYTGVMLRDFAQDIIHTDGSLRRLVTSTNVGDSGYWEVQPLTGFSNNNPVWGTAVRTAYLPKITKNDPAFYSVSFAPVTSTGINIVFCPDKDNQGYHLGAVKNGQRKYLWKTAKSTSTNYKGPMPKDGAFDLGNNVEYPGGHVYAIERSILWNYHGEFWKNSQTNIWNHYYDNGLMLGQFGITSLEGEATNKEAFAMGAGNVFASTIVKVGSDYYIYHNDECNHAGVHRWKINGLNSIATQTISLNLNNLTGSGLIGTYFDGNDLNNFNMKISVLDPVVNLSTPPSSITNTNNFSTRWTGFVKPLFSQNYTFYVNTSKGVRLWINGQLIIDKWTNASLFENSSQAIALQAGILYSVRMEINGGTAILSWSSSSQSKQIIPSGSLFPGETVDYAEGYDLMEGLGNTNVLANGLYGWNRNAISEINNSYDDYWHAETNIKSHLPEEPSLSIAFRNYNNSYSVSRDLGKTSTCMKQWKLEGKLLFEQNYPNWESSNGGFIDVLDDQGKIIARITHEMQYINNNNKPTQIRFNGTAIVNVNEHHLYSTLNNTTPFSINASGKTLTFTYGKYNSISTKLFDTSANWNMPKTIKFHFFGGDYDKAIDVRALRFIPTVNDTPRISNSNQLKICQGSSVTFEAPQGVSYLWSNMATTRSITVNTSGQYRVTVNYGNSCILSSAVTNVTVNPTPKPIITLLGNALMSNYITGNQWYLNGQIITGANSQTLKVFRAGAYSVIVTDTNGCQGNATFSVALPYEDVQISSECAENGSKIIFSWKSMDSEDEFAYGVEYSIDNGLNWSSYGEIKAQRKFAGNVLYDYDLKVNRNPNTMILYRWYSLGANNERVQEKEISAPMCGGYDMDIYPNPFNSQLSILLKSENISDRTLIVEIFDLNGRNVYTNEVINPLLIGGSNEIKLEGFENLSQGIYHIRVSAKEEQLYNSRILKQ